MHTKDASPEQNPSSDAELDPPPPSGEVPQRRGERAGDVAPALDAQALLGPCASFFPTLDCLTDDEVLAYSEGRMSGCRRVKVACHVRACSSCQQLVQWAASCTRSA